MNIWAAFPSINEDLANLNVDRWHKVGAKVAVLMDIGHKCKNADISINDQWLGFPLAINKLCRLCVSNGADIVVCIGHDVYPDERYRVNDIGQQLVDVYNSYFWVMQPIGDKYGSYNTCCVHPWIGKDFIKKSYQGTGPYHTGYYHYYSDQELQDVAKLMGVFSQRNIFQFHDHWDRYKKERPKHLMMALAFHPRDKQLYESRKAENFPGHQPARWE